MKLYLSSYRIPDLKVLVDLVGKPPSQATVGLIPNAKDYYAPRARTVKIRFIREWLESLGFRVAIIDLNELHGVRLKEALLATDLLWAMGGNTFCLREAMQSSGFDKIVREVLETGIVYAGESAGACVAGTDLKGIELADDDEFAAKVVWQGLQLTPHYIVPHTDNPDFGPAAAQIIELRASDADIVALGDNQAWVVVNGDAWKITGMRHDAPGGVAIS